MGSLNVGLFQTWQTPWNLFKIAHNSLIWCHVEHKWPAIIKAETLSVFAARCLKETYQHWRNTRKRVDILLLLGRDIQLNLAQVAIRTFHRGHCIKNNAGGTKEHHANAATMPSGNSLPERSKLQLLLGKLKRKDVYSIFSEPLNPEEVEDYYHFIKEPMDFGTITTKLEGGSYKTLQEFEHDVTLVWRNAMLFNDSSTVYHKEACAIRNLAKKLFNSLKTDPENFVELPKTGCRGGKRFKYSEVNRSSTYRPLNTSLNENESIVSAVCLSPQELVQNRDGHGESLLQFVKNLGPSANTFAGPKLQDLNGESIEAIPDRDTRNFSFTNALLGDENPEWDTYSNLGGKPGSNLHKYQRIADIGSYSSTVEEAGQDWKRFRPTEAPPQPVCSQSTSAGWSSQWLEIGPSTSDVKKSVAGQENGSGQDWKRFRPTEAPPQPVSSRLFLPQSTSVGWPSLRRDIGASTSDVKKSISLKDIDEWLRYL